jgi:hypothetical protein
MTNAIVFGSVAVTLISLYNTWRTRVELRYYRELVHRRSS